jgi:capsular exopolysaccharide synthesis family protein
LDIENNSRRWAVPTAEQNELSLNDVWSILRRRGKVIAATTGTLFAAALILCVVSQRRYQAVGELQVEKSEMDGLGLASMMGSSADATDALDGNITIQTEATILQSDTLALKVIKELNLEPTSDFRPHFHLMSILTGWLTPSGSPDPINATLEDSPARRTHALAVFSLNLKVKPVSGTRLIQVSYTNPDPRIASAVVNRLIQQLTDFGFQTRYTATTQASEWLGSQLSDLRKQSEDLQGKVIQLQRESGVFALGGGSEADGKTQNGTTVYSSVLDRLQQATATLAQAESNRIVKGAVYQAAKSGNAELISGLAGNASVMSASAGLANSLSLIQSLRLQQATLQGQYNQLSSKFGPAYPKLGEVQANIKALDGATQDEISRIEERAKSDFEVSQTVEQGARQVFNEQKRDADQLNDKAIEYSIVREEAEQSRGLYETLLGRLKEAGLLEGLRSSNISVVDPALAPSKPATPNAPLYLGLALAGGLFLGSVLALVVDLRDKSIHDLRELDSNLGDSPLGILPAFAPMPKSFQHTEGRIIGPDGLLVPQIVALDQPHSPYVEALRGLRTSLLLSRGGAPPQAILVTSSIASEGKTTFSLNLAVLLAQHGKKVLLVDADLRSPSLHRNLGVSAEHGFSTLLSGQTKSSSFSDFTTIDAVPGLSVLCAGPVPPYPSELLGSDQMEVLLRGWRQQFDFVLFDSAPVLPVTDSVILSELVDSKLLLARFGVTERQSLERSYQLLQHSSRNGQKISVVINAVKQSASSYQEYYGYSDLSYPTMSEETVA